MYDNKPYVVQEKALRTLFLRPTVDEGFDQAVAFVKRLVDAEEAFLNLQAGKIQPVSVIGHGGNLTGVDRLGGFADIDRARTANDNKQPAKKDQPAGQAA